MKQKRSKLLQFVWGNITTALDYKAAHLQDFFSSVYAIEPDGKFDCYYNYNHFMALWILSGTTRVSQYQKVHFAIFWIFWCKMKITPADARTIQMDYHT